MDSKNVKNALEKISNKNKAKILQKFFKTGKGEYGEGDIFLGVTVPQSREIAKRYSEISFEEIKKLLKSKIHEERLVAILLLVHNYEKTKKEKNENEMKKIFDFYLSNTEHINNWDLVDLSAPKIVGDYLFNKKSERKILYELAKSNKKGINGWQWLWEKRIAIISTYTFIKNNYFEDTKKLSEIFLKEKHDLLHKATGWMLREMGKQNEKEITNFLDKHKTQMPRTMLRYAIEKLSEEKRKHYLKK